MLNDNALLQSDEVLEGAQFVQPGPIEQGGNNHGLRKMDLVSKLHQPAVLEYIKTIDPVEGGQSPFIVELDTTEVCNLKCKGCISDDVLLSHNSFSSERLMRLAEELIEAGVKGVILIGGGEPLAHSQVGAFMEKIGENGIQIGITTNGSYIYKFVDIIAQYAHWTRVSLDAGTDETFYHLRPAKNGRSLFGHITGSMKDLAKIKRGRLGYSFLIRTVADGFGIRSNISDLYPAARLAKEIGCDYFEIKPSYKFSDNSDHYLIRHDQAEMQAARREIDKCRILADKNFKVILSINLEHSLSGTQNYQPKTYHSCPAAQVRTLICPSGAYVCPYFRGKKHMMIGRLQETSFKEMWYGETRKKIMERLNPEVDCKMHCIRHDTNLEIFRMFDEQSFEPWQDLGDFFI